MKNLLFFLILFSTTFLNAQTYDFEWAKSFGGILNETSKAIIVDDDGNIYTLGEFSGEVDFDPGVDEYNLTAVGGSKVFIQKLDNNGNFVWAKFFGEGGVTASGGMTFDDDDNLLVIGNFTGAADFDAGPGVEIMTAVGVRDMFILKLNVDAEFIWVKTCGGDGALGFGKRIDTDEVGNVYVSGFFQETIDFNPGVAAFDLTSNGGFDSFILKLSNSGEFMWAHSFGSTEIDNANGLVVFDDGSVCITGGFKNTVDFDADGGTFNLTSAGNFDIYILKFDTDGNFEWANRIGGESYDLVNNMCLDSVGNVVIIGAYTNTVDFDSGDGVFNMETAVGITAGFVLKINEDGEFIWAKSLQGSADIINYGLTTDRNNIIYVTGAYVETVDFDPNAGVYEMTADEGYDVFILSLGEAGEFLWVTSISGTGDLWGNELIISGTELYTIGVLNDTANFDPSDSDFELASNGLGDVFIQKLKISNPAGLHNETSKNNISLYPNPFQNQLVVELQQGAEQVKIVDINGRIVYTESTNLAAGNLILNLSHLQKGMYFITVQYENSNQTSKVFKQ